MHSLQTLSDRLDIQDLLVAYAGAIDRRDFAALDSVFTPDAWVDYGAFGGPAGRYPEIRRFLETSLTPERYEGYQHMVGNSEIVLDGDSARGRVLCFNPMVLPRGTAPEPRVGFYGLWYIDEYRRTPAGWRIVSRNEEKCFAHNFPPR